ncbi:MAG: enolase C-terminal domain-like protein [Defluviicoccus sp.]|nr:enolase C-terminal domain-like protein [Defluviicoccus sp.]
MNHATVTAELLVRGLSVRAVDVPLRRPIRTASGTIETAPLVLIDLYSDADVVGHSYVFCYKRVALKPVAQLTANLESLIEGQALAPLDIDGMLQQRFRLLGPQGLTGIAMAGVDMAAWDALAKARGVPLANLLGGAPRCIPAYDSLGMGGAKIAAREIAESAALGFTAAKIKIGYADVKDDVAAIRAARRAGGDGFQVMVDYNQCLSVPEAIRRIRVLDDEGLAWIEEPTRADDFAGHALIAAEAKTPLQLGENWCGIHDMAKSLAAGASDYAMPEAMKIGGVTGWLRAAALAQAAGTPVSSHAFPEVSRHLLAVTPTCHWLEALDLAGAILQDPVKIERGYAIMPTASGTGIEWDEDAVDRYLVP